MIKSFFGQWSSKSSSRSSGKHGETIGRLDCDKELRERVLPLCRLKYGEVWQDEHKGHRVGVLDATRLEDVTKIVDADAKLIINDPPYNIAVGNLTTANLSRVDIDQYLDFSRKWLSNALAITDDNATLYIWAGADYRNDFQPLPDLLVLLRQFRQLKPRNWITVRNQRGYGTQKNWMWVRQELLHYVKGNPVFNVEAEYTDIPKILRGYYKEVDGKVTENLERSRSSFIRAGNVWVDVQQVFYRMEENVPGCYAQKPLKAVNRLVAAGSDKDDLVVDFFAHSGSTLISGEILDRRVYTFDLDPIFAEITIRRLEHYRKTGETGWQWRNPFAEIETQGVPHR